MKKLQQAACLLLALLLLWGTAAGEGLALPEGVTAIGAEAFAGDLSLEEAVLPAGLLSVGDRAFEDCGELDIVSLAGADTAIGEDAFAGCGPALLIRAPYGSAAHLYASAHSLDYQAGTRYRALLIAQDYAGASGINPLEGPPNDAANMRACLTGLPGTPWQVTDSANLTADGITAAIASAFADATEADVSLVFYAGHGGYASGTGSYLLGTDKGKVYASHLRTVLDRVPGRKVVIIDACNSGGLLVDHSVTTRGVQSAAGDAGSFVSGMISPFTARSRDALTGSLYFVMAACAEDEKSYELSFETTSCGAFTAMLLTGIGYQVPAGSWQSEPAADTNGDRAISFSEAFTYAKRVTSALMQRYDLSQNAACYPSSCAWFAPFRYR